MAGWRSPSSSCRSDWASNAMPLLFSYGTLQRENVQLSTFGRRLTGDSDELLMFEPSSVRIEDPQLVAATGRTHHANVTFNGNAGSRVPGMVFEITDGELASVDEYEAAFSYKRVDAAVASGRQVWVYVSTAPDGSCQNGTGADEGRSSGGS
jgi:gamma-glutamylcyclotransferase (GGCT)/AIG2-like uncharacterized protein YtfP